MSCISYQALHVAGTSSRDYEDLNALMWQLTPEPRYIGINVLQHVLPNGCIRTARDTCIRTPEQPFGCIVGMATLLMSEKLAGSFGLIEDVVVNDLYRGLGIGKTLMEKLIQVARHLDLPYIELTSNPARSAANELYVKLGFERRDTNCYRLKLRG